MMIAIIGAISVAILFLCLYLKERRIKNDVKTASESSARISRLENNYNTQTSLTHELIKEAVRFNGFVPIDLNEDLIGFKVNGENYCITTGALPIINIHKGYSIDPADYDIDIMKKASAFVTDNCIVGKVSVDEDGIGFNVGTIECSYEHLCASLNYYLRVIQDLKDRHCQIYQDLYNEQEVLRDQQGKFSTGNINQSMLS